jgi:hypothetical protein
MFRVYRFSVSQASTFALSCWVTARIREGSATFEVYSMSSVLTFSAPMNTPRFRYCIPPCDSATPIQARNVCPRAGTASMAAPPASNGARHAPSGRSSAAPARQRSRQRSHPRGQPPSGLRTRAPAQGRPSCGWWLPPRLRRPRRQRSKCGPRRLAAARPPTPAGPWSLHTRDRIRARPRPHSAQGRTQGRAQSRRSGRGGAHCRWRGET